MTNKDKIMFVVTHVLYIGLVNITRNNRKFGGPIIYTAVANYSHINHNNAWYKNSYSLITKMLFAISFSNVGFFLIQSFTKED